MMPNSTQTSFPLQVLFAIGPWLALLVGCLLVLWILVRCMRLHVQCGVLKQLHVDQKGGVQSLSFVLTVPLFIFIMLFIVQLSQITIGQIGVEYAAFAAARSAIVWIPARASTIEGEMQVGRGLQLVELVAYNGDDEIDLDLNAYMEFGLVHDGTTHIYAIYEVAPGGAKYEKIRSAAALALMNICPSRSVVTQNTSASGVAGRLVEPLSQAYVSLAPNEGGNPKIEDRLRNKLIYAFEHTDIKIEIRHKDSNAYLTEHDLLPDRYEYRMNEIDWQDQVIVDVFHEFALLPGPGRLLARAPQARPGTEVDESYADGQAADEVGARIQERHDQTYVWPLQASARLTVEGFKPYFIDQQPPAAVQPYESQTSPGLVPW
jgi:hypothetical protein